jgi:acetyl esterase/lipase
MQRQTRGGSGGLELSLMRRLRFVLLAVVAVGLVLLPSPGAVAKRARPCEERSWTGGTTEWCNGSLVYRDYVYDDYGADSGGDSPHGTGLFRPKGDVDHRQHGQALDSTDLLALRLRAEGSELVVRFELNTLLPTDATVGAVAIGTDPAAGTAVRNWGVVNTASAGWDVAYKFDARDPGANVIEGRVPLPSGDFRIQAVVALGDGTPMNVAFRPGETGNWWEDKQAAALAANDISAFGANVPLAALTTAPRHDPAPPSGPGYYERVLRTNHSMGEGVDYAGVPGPTTAKYEYLGPVQPYALFVPDGPAPHQAMLLLHGSGSAHSAVIQSAATQKVLGSNLNRILVSPLSRGFDNSYVDEGATDALDSLADVEAHWGVDRDREFVSGYSMGGGGALQLSTWFPDRWAGVIDWVGFTGDCFNGTPIAQGRQREPHTTALSDVHYHFTNDASQRSGCPLGARGNVVDYLENLRHVPSGHLFGGADELVWANEGAYMMQRLADAGVPHHLWFHPAAEHFTYAVLGDWRKEAAYTKDLVRVHRPARVVYRTNSYLYVPRLDLLPDGAYWVDGIAPRDTSTTPQGDAVVDLTSHACATGNEKTLEITRDAGTDPVPWIGQQGVLTGEVPTVPGNAISGTLTNVSSLTIKVAEACLRPGRGVDVSGIVTDGPTTITFDDGRPAVHIG